MYLTQAGRMSLRPTDAQARIIAAYEAHPDLKKLHESCQRWREYQKWGGNYAAFLDRFYPHLTEPKEKPRPPDAVNGAKKKKGRYR